MATAPRFPAPLQLAFRKLASQLMREAQQGQGRAPLRVLFTGSENGVGTSTLAEGVAGLLAGARSGSVLLVGGCPPSKGVKPDDGETSGAEELVRVPSLPPFQTAQKFTRELERLGKGHRFLLIDANPITDDLETQLLADVCDVVWLVLAAGRSRLPNAQNAAELLNSTKAGSKGVVFNRKGRGLPQWLQRLTDRLSPSS